MAGGQLHRTKVPLLGKTKPVPATWLLVFNGVRTPMCDEHKREVEADMNQLERKYGSILYQYEFLQIKPTQLELGDV